MTKKKKSQPVIKRGRPTREDLGLDPTVPVTIRVEPKVIEILKARHGSISNALRAAAGL